MTILKLKGVHLTYPPRFKQHVETPSMDADIDDDQAATEGDEYRPESVQGSERTRRESVDALRGVTFSLAAGEALGVLGKVGSGRSTLLSVISGVLRPDRGTVLIRGYATGLMGAGAGFLTELPVHENIVRNGILLGMAHKRAKELVPEIAAFAGMTASVDRPLRELSRAHSKRLAYSVALFAEPSVFLGDEELVVGSPEFREACLKRLAAFPNQSRALVVVSNRAEHLKALCTRALVMDHGMVTFDGTVEAALRQYRRAHRSGRRAVADPTPGVEPGVEPGVASEPD